MHIPDLTPSLVSNLKIYKPTESAEFAASFDSLPQEIKDQTLDQLLRQPISLDCNYLVPQHHWKQAFLQIPFLWDLDLDIIDQKSQKAPSGDFGWDWEKMTRQLMTPVTKVEGHAGNPGAWNYSQVGLDVPRGLKNRRRIWQILENMYPNDVGMEYMGDEDEEGGFSNDQGRD